jgi:predicted double-glycine peptidase
MRDFIKGLLFFFLGFPAAYAGTVVLGSVPFTGGPLIAHVQSLESLKFKDIVRQHTDYSCGAAAIATILDYAYGQHESERDVIVGMLKVSDAAVVREQGFSLLNMAQYLKGIGMRGAGYRVPAHELTALRIPAIVLLKMQGYEHFVVLKAVVGGRAYIADPALGNKSLSFARFKKYWDGVVFLVIGPHYDKRTVLRSHLSVVRVRGVMTNMERGLRRHVADFGFIPATLF